MPHAEVARLQRGTAAWKIVTGLPAVRQNQSTVPRVGDQPMHRRIALVCRSGLPLEEAWSGIPAGLMGGLDKLGVAAHFVDAEPGPSLMRAAQAWAMVVRRNRFGGMLAPEIRELRRWTARRRASRIGTFDAVIQMGSDFGIPFPRPFVTYEDMTVPQRIRLSSVKTALGTTAVRRWIAMQGTCYEVAIGCCVASRWAAESIVQDYGIEPIKVHVVGFGRNYNPQPVARDWTQPRFLFVGYDWQRKNGPMVVRAFSRVRDSFPSAQLHLVGGHPRIHVEGVVAHGPLGFSEPRQRARAEALFEAATCFVMPSQFEPFGMVYAEAAAAGVASIGTVVGGARDVIGDSGGLLVDPSEESALTDAMIAMCDPVRASTMGAAAFERSRLFTWEAVAERIVQVLRLRNNATRNRLPVTQQAR
jgi:glycosyltransferase involved in cell wall biosynthesis